MTLSCYCEFEKEPGMVFWYEPKDFSVFQKPRRKRCSSCWKRINHGDVCAVFQRYKVPEHEVEVRIYCEDGEIKRASYHLCEECAGLWFSLSELGFNCVDPTENMREVVKEYAMNYGPKTATKAKSA